jgi:hypothetical protein
MLNAMTGKTCRLAVPKEAVGCCETAHVADLGLTLEQLAESHVYAGTTPVMQGYCPWQVGATGFPPLQREGIHH